MYSFFQSASFFATVSVFFCLGCRNPTSEPAATDSAVPRPRQAQNAPVKPISAETQAVGTDTTAQAAAVGSQACQTCHEDYYNSYQLNHHSRSLALQSETAQLGHGTPSASLPASTFDHLPSGRRYSIEVDDNDTMTHVESLLGADGSAIEVARYDIDYVVGSGNAGHSFLTGVDGFLIQSPITWYADEANWGMSPGYDVPNQGGFDRIVSTGCLTCHTGQVQARKANTSQVDITEAAIGCERCHGPGSAHVEFWEHHSNDQSDTDAVANMVNPASLTRDLADAICADCHMQSDYRVSHKGIAADAFRPGQRIEAVRTHFAKPNLSGKMKLVSHFEQLTASACYTKSESLSCVTCHSPHHEANSSVVSYEQSLDACLNCHEQKECEPIVAGQWDGSAEQCIGCHMPRGETKVAHVSLTHHRIGVHDPEHGAGALAKKDVDGLQQVTASVADPNVERRARLIADWLALEETPDGLKQDVANQVVSTTNLETFDHRADSVLSAAIARVLFWYGQYSDSLRIAQTIAETELTGSDAREAALRILLRYAELTHQQSDKIRTLQELTKLRRHATDYFCLGQELVALGTKEGLELARDAFEQSAMIAPRHADTHRALKQISLLLGDNERAQKEQQILDLLGPA